VVGGGDSAVEAAAALAEAGNRVKLSYRKESLDRPKPENLERFEFPAGSGTHRTHFPIPTQGHQGGETVLKTRDGEKTVKAIRSSCSSAGIAHRLLQRSGLRMAGQKIAPGISSSSP